MQSFSQLTCSTSFKRTPSVMKRIAVSSVHYGTVVTNYTKQAKHTSFTCTIAFITNLVGDPPGAF